MAAPFGSCDSGLEADGVTNDPSAEMAEVGRVKLAGTPPGRLKVSVVRGDVRKMHRSPENASALFQVASQFNLLEMVGPAVTPEHGVTRYKDDPPKARRVRSPPARRRSIATISRCDGHGQTNERQAVASRPVHGRPCHLRPRCRTPREAA